MFLCRSTVSVFNINMHNALASCSFIFVNITLNVILKFVLHIYYVIYIHEYQVDIAAWVSWLLGIRVYKNSDSVFTRSWLFRLKGASTKPKWDTLCHANSHSCPWLTGDNMDMSRDESESCTNGNLSIDPTQTKPCVSFVPVISKHMPLLI